MKKFLLTSLVVVVTACIFVALGITFPDLYQHATVVVHLVFDRRLPLDFNPANDLLT